MHPPYQHPLLLIPQKLFPRHSMYTIHGSILHTLNDSPNDTICLVWIVLLLRSRPMRLHIILNTDIKLWTRRSSRIPQRALLVGVLLAIFLERHAIRYVAARNRLEDMPGIAMECPLLPRPRNFQEVVHAAGNQPNGCHLDQQGALLALLGEVGYGGLEFQVESDADVLLPEVAVAELNQCARRILELGRHLERFFVSFHYYSGLFDGADLFLKIGADGGCFLLAYSNLGGWWWNKFIVIFRLCFY
mmetsp:Transcript_14278/g.25480  ORF Transcript_14278/g.25480 Transcript_14278/m.25480 type:complete len:246 (+) Transcript_14278:315-1052(+)